MAEVIFDTNLRVGGASGPLMIAGTGAPESVVTAPVGSIYMRSDGGTGTAVYRKETGAGSTGWVAIAAGGGGSPGGSANQAQFNNAGAFAGSSALTFASDTAGAAFSAGTAAAGSWPTIASGTPLTTPVAGTVERDANCLYYTPANNNRGYIPVRHFCRSDVNFALVNSTAEQAIFPPAFDTITLATGLYKFEGIIAVNGMSATSGNMSIDILGAGTAVCSSWQWLALGRDAALNAAGSAAGASSMNGQQSPAAVITGGTSTEICVKIEGTVRVTTGGTMIPSLTLAVASAASSVAGSYFMIERLGSTTTTSLGQWS